MRIGMVLANHPFPPDIRVVKEAEALAPLGHESLLLCRREPGQHETERIGVVDVVRHRVHPAGPLRRRLDSLRYLLTLDSPSWRSAMVALVRERGAQAIHVHDLPYARCGIRAAREAGVPVVIDLHENHPAALAIWKRRPIDRLLFSPKRAARLERWAVREADRVVVVVQEAKDRLVGLGGEPERIVVFGNMEPRSLAEPEPPALDHSHGPRLVYVGGVAAHRGLETAVASMPAILAERPDARLTIVGDGNTLEEHRRQAAALGVADAVTFTGWLGQAEAMEYVRAATIALVPHLRSSHTDATIPHKLFQYMALGRPVLVSDCAPLARVVRDAECGEVFRAGDAADLAAKALVLTDPVLAERLGAAGRAAVLDRYNLEQDAPALAAVYDALGAGRIAAGEGAASRSRDGMPSGRS